nr:glycosyltransferase [Cedecea sulfonylureivorans]
MSVYKSDDLSYLKSAVDSIFLQSYQCIDLFIYRDGEVGDNLQKYLDFLSNYHNVKVYFSAHNQGLAHALNFLIEKVLVCEKYKFIARMDSDDISHPARIRKQVNFMIRNLKTDVCGTACREFGSSFAMKEKTLPLNHEELIDLSITNCPFVHPSVLFRREVFINGARYPEHTSYTEDMALWFLLLEKGFHFSNLPDVLLSYRVNENMLSRRKGIKKALSEIKIRLKYMVKLKRVSVRNVILISLRLFFHLLPTSVMSFAYKKVRHVYMYKGK